MSPEAFPLNDRPINPLPPCPLDNVSVLPEKKLYAEVLSEKLAYLLQRIHTIRRGTDLPPWTEEEKNIFEQEFMHTAFLHFSHFLNHKTGIHEPHMRKDGQSRYFDEHLVGSLLNLVNVFKVTELETVLAQLKHDDIEDLSDMHDYLFTTPPETSEDLAEEQSKIRKRIYDLISAVSKVRTSDKTATREEIFRILLSNIYSLSPQVALIKLSDRLHNMKTIKHMKPDAQQRIARETYEVYSPLARSLQLYTADDMLIDNCLEILNPNLLHAYQKFQASKKKIVNNFCTKLQSHFQTHLFRDASFPMHTEETAISHFLRRVPINKPIEDITIDDLQIKEDDLLHEIIVLFNEQEEWYQQISTEIIYYLSQKTNRPVDLKPSRRPHKGKIISGDLADKETDSMYRLMIRCNTQQEENLSDLGELKLTPRASNHPLAYFKLSQSIRNDIAYVLKKSGTKGENIFTIAAQKLLQPTRFFIYTKNKKPLLVHRTATWLDVAFSIHKNIGLTAKGVHIAEISDRRGASESIFNLARKDQLLTVKTDYKRDMIDIAPNMIRIEPSWIPLVSYGDTKDAIKKALRQLSLEEKQIKGETYLDTLQELFPTICTNEFIDHLIEEQKIPIKQPSMTDQQTAKEKFLKNIGDGSFDMIEALASLSTMEKQTEWMISGTLQNKSGEYLRFLDQIQSYPEIPPNIKWSHTEEEKIELLISTPVINYFSHSQQQESAREQAYSILRLFLKLKSDGYAIKVESKRNKA